MGLASHRAVACRRRDVAARVTSSRSQPIRRGDSSRAISPPFRHPTRASHVFACATGEGAAISLASAIRQPANHRPDEYGSTPRAVKVLLEIVQHVDERVAHFTRRPQQPGVVSVPPHRAAAPAEPVHEAGYPDGQPAHTTLEPRRPIRFDQQVQMILLDAELQNAKARRRARAKRGLDRHEKALAPERGDIDRGAERHVGRTARVVRSAATMRHVAPPGIRLPTRAVAPATPGLRSKLELSRLPLHLEFGRNLARLCRDVNHPSRSGLETAVTPPSGLFGDRVSKRSRDMGDSSARRWALPWKERSSVDQRTQFIEALMRAGPMARPLRIAAPRTAQAPPSATHLCTHRGRCPARAIVTSINRYPCVWNRRATVTHVFGLKLLPMSLNAHRRRRSAVAGTPTSQAARRGAPPSLSPRDRR